MGAIHNRAEFYGALRADWGPLTEKQVEALERALNVYDGIQAVPVKTALRDAAAFFSQMRKSKLFGATIDQGEVDGCNAILAACGDDGWPIADTAYGLATAYHETAATMQPIKEYGGPAYFHRMYDIAGARPQKAKELGNLSPGDGAKYCGRGYVQLTGKTNYQKASAVVGVDLVSNPDLAMKPSIAAKIMTHGMRKGWFTGRDLDDDLPRQGLASIEQFVRSRDIINGTDRAAKIANEAAAFQSALAAGGWA